MLFQSSQISRKFNTARHFWRKIARCHYIVHTMCHFSAFNQISCGKVTGLLGKIQGFWENAQKLLESDVL